MSEPRHIDPESVDAFLAERGPGDAISGRVDTIVSFGAFIELVPGVHGLLHESEWSAPPELGQKIDVRIADVDRQRRRISLRPA